MVRRLITALALALFVSVGSVNSSAMPRQAPFAGSNFDWSLSAIYSLPHCTSSSQLDCIDSVGVFDQRGTLQPGVWSFDQFSRKEVYSNHIRLTGTSNWVATIDGKQKILKLFTMAVTPAFGVTLGKSYLNSFVNVDDPENTKVQFSIRTSWLKERFVSLGAEDSGYLKENFEGGSRWTFTGKGFTESRYFDWQKGLASNANADTDLASFEFSVVHQSENEPDVDRTSGCLLTGSNLTSNLQIGRNVPFSISTYPEWDGSLSFPFLKTFADTHGQKNFGFIQFRATKQWLDCKFPSNNLTNANSIKLTLTDAKGTSVLADAKVRKDADGLYFYVRNLSSTIGTVRLIAVAAKKTTITCVTLKKPLKTKKVTAVKPTCPAGYKKKS